MNDKTELVREAKNDKASRCCWSAYQKRLREMRLDEMLPNLSGRAQTTSDSILGVIRKES